MKKLELLKTNRFRFHLGSLAIVQLIFFSSFGQNNFFSLSDELKEISGLECYKDTLFFAINDGGNGDFVYILNKDFEIKKKVKITNFKNYDWEDITMDEEFLYLGDIGNNLHKRQNLKLGRLRIIDLLNYDNVKVEIMYISYKNQTDFPPNPSELNYDSETLISDGSDLYIFSKNKTNPYNGISFVYKFKFKPNSSQKLDYQYKLEQGKGKWMFDSFTGGTFHNGSFYLLTYNKILKLKLDDHGFSKIDSKGFSYIKQRESLCFDSTGALYVSNEFHKWLGSQKVQKIKW